MDCNERVLMRMTRRHPRAVSELAPPRAARASRSAPESPLATRWRVRAGNATGGAGGAGGAFEALLTDYLRVARYRPSTRRRSDGVTAWCCPATTTCGWHSCDYSVHPLSAIGQRGEVIADLDTVCIRRGGVLVGEHEPDDSGLSRTSPAVALYATSIREESECVGDPRVIWS